MDIPSFITDTKEDKQDRLILYYQTVPSLFINNQNIEEEIKKYKKDLNQFMNEYNIKKEDYEKILKLWFLYDKLDAQITIEGYPTKISEFIKDKKLEFDISNFKSFKNELYK